MTEEQLEEYLLEIEDWDMTRDQKVEWLQTLYCMMEQCVDLAFENDPTSLALKERERDRRQTSQAQELPDIRDLLAEHIEAQKSEIVDS